MHVAKDRKINIDDKSLEHQVGDMSRYNTKEFTNVPGLDNKNQSGMSSSKGMEDSSSGHKTAMGSMGEHAQGQMK